MWKIKNYSFNLSKFNEFQKGKILFQLDFLDVFYIEIILKITTLNSWDGVEFFKKKWEKNSLIKKNLLKPTSGSNFCTIQFLIWVFFKKIRNVSFLRKSKNMRFKILKDISFLSFKSKNKNPRDKRNKKANHSLLLPDVLNSTKKDNYRQVQNRKLSFGKNLKKSKLLFLRNEAKHIRKEVAESLLTKSNNIAVTINDQLHLIDSIYDQAKNIDSEVKKTNHSIKKKYSENKNWKNQWFFFCINVVFTILLFINK
mmetsp:Transcript_30308/g.47458  ORF Transcript_30308/g.47458 Transcript_30308/m.47458 type:complete len:255 (+) Transcript_30308:2850-3614(+)